MQQEEKVQELEEYIQIQEDYFAKKMSKSILQQAVTHEAHEKETEQLESVNTNLTRICAELEVKYEEKRLALLIAEAKLMSEKGSTEARISERHRELTVAQYRATLGKEKVCDILKAHKLKSQQLVTDTLDKGWKAWSAQAAELQLFLKHKDKGNTKT